MDEREIKVDRDSLHYVELVLMGLIDNANTPPAYRPVTMMAITATPVIAPGLEATAHYLVPLQVAATVFGQLRYTRDVACSPEQRALFDDIAERTYAGAIASAAEPT